MIRVALHLFPYFHPFPPLPFLLTGEGNRTVTEVKKITVSVWAHFMVIAVGVQNTYQT